MSSQPFADSNSAGIGWVGAMFHDGSQLPAPRAGVAARLHAVGDQLVHPVVDREPPARNRQRSAAIVRSVRYLGTPAAARIRSSTD